MIFAAMRGTFLQPTDCGLLGHYSMCFYICLLSDYTFVSFFFITSRSFYALVLLLLCFVMSSVDSIQLLYLSFMPYMPYVPYMPLLVFGRGTIKNRAKTKLICYRYKGFVGSTILCMGY